MRIVVFSRQLAAVVVSGMVILVSTCNLLFADEKTTVGSAPSSAAPAASEQYFIDFRSRPGYLFGHTFVRYGRLDEHGKLLDVQIAGIYPLQDQQGLILGSLIPVAASVRKVEGDVKEKATNNYRKKLSPAQYAKLMVAMRHLRATEHSWHLLFANCNDFAIEVANALGMRTPSSWLPPASFVAALRDLNQR